MRSHSKTSSKRLKADVADKENLSVDRKTRALRSSTPRKTRLPLAALKDVTNTPPVRRTSQKKSAREVVKETVEKAAAEGANVPEEKVVDSSRPVGYQTMSHEEWDLKQMTAGPDHVIYWWRAAEERQHALKDVLLENIKLREEVERLKSENEELRNREGDAEYFALMSRVWQEEAELQSSFSY